jgi:hypothetical protein
MGKIPLRKYGWTQNNFVNERRIFIHIQGALQARASSSG